MIEDGQDTARDSAAIERQVARDERKDRRLEIIVALVLATAGLASAWASFQGGTWDKREAEGFARSNSYLTESSQYLIRSGQEQAVAAALFLQWIDAKSDRQALRADVIANHMPPWFADEFTRWRAGLPKDFNQFRPNSPLPAFKGPSLSAARETRARSEAARREAEKAGQIGDSYDNATVILATALFLAGIASVLHRPFGRWLVVVLAGLLTASAIASMLMITGQSMA